MEKNRQIHLYLIGIFIFGFCVFSINGTHFRGAIFMLRPTANGEPNEMEISFNIAWRRDSREGGDCNEDTIQNGDLLGSGRLRCRSGCDRTITTLRYYCTDFSNTENWSFGQRYLSYVFPEDTEELIVEFVGRDWIAPFNTDWTIVTSVNLSPRNDTGRINSTPRAITAPVFRLLENCNHSIKIPVSDPDLDVIRCRWAVGSSECGGICGEFPNAVLNGMTCEISYESVFGLGYKAAAIMIEDFASGNDTSPLSSVALQFLVYVYAAPSENSTCTQQPVFVPPTIKAGLCIAIPPNHNFTENLVAYGGGVQSDITEIETVSPSGMIKSRLLSGTLPHHYYVTVTWSPGSDQINQTHPFCFTAHASSGLSSAANCIELLVGYYPPAPVNTSLSPASGSLVFPHNTRWSLHFTKNIRRPIIQASILFKDHNDHAVVYEIKSSSSEITFTDDVSIAVTPRFIFPEKTRLYVEVERGFVVGVEGCLPANEPVTYSNTFWMFTTRDVTPPVLTFTDANVRNGENATFAWVISEVATSVCQIDADEILNCSSGHLEVFGMSEGMHALQVTSTDAENNVQITTFEFNVDLTPPSTYLTSKPNSISNKNPFTFTFRCDELLCTFECYLSDVVISHPSNWQSCNSLPIYKYFTTPTLLNERTYTLFVRATDDVGNVGNWISYQWTVDLIQPLIVVPPDNATSCRDDLSPDVFGRPSVSDNMDMDPRVSFTDISNSSCLLRRQWTAIDVAGNIGTGYQTIVLDFQPAIHLIKTLRLTCEAASGNWSIPKNTAMSYNPCDRNIILSLADDNVNKTCPGEVTRTWTALDVCTGNTVIEIQKLNIFNVCPIEACGYDLIPPHGICSMGSCICNKPWSGQDCDIFMESPLISAIDGDTVLEELTYTKTVSVSQGTGLLTWSLSEGLLGMDIDVMSGEIRWNSTRVGNYEISVIVENQVGIDFATFTLNVTPSYTAYLNALVNISSLIKAKPLLLTGVIRSLGTQISFNQAKAFSVDVTNTITSAVRVVQGISRFDGTFSIIYQPSQNEYGNYTASARHPGQDPQPVQITWQVLGVSVHPNNILLTDEIINNFQKIFQNVFQVTNDGPLALHSVNFQWNEVELDRYGIKISITSPVNGFLSSLGIGEQVSVDIDVTSTQPISLTFIIQLLTLEGLYRNVLIDLRINEVLPKFDIMPATINTSVSRGSQKLISFNVTNSGNVEATDVRVRIPSSDWLTLISFGTRNSTESSWNLDPSQSATGIILFSVADNDPLGTISGDIVVQSEQIFSTLRMTVAVVSDNLGNITFLIEDEYTYFAEGNPLVANVSISLENRRGNFRASISVDGRITFNDLPEDIYELRAYAARHVNLIQRVLVSAGISEQRIFMERISVEYSWSVTQVPFEDVYVIDIQADFETNVPFPVVTISPNTVSLDDLESGLLPFIVINITNHGLIRGDRFGIILPTHHPFLEFEFEFPIPETIEAKTTTLVTVVAKKNVRNKRIVPLILRGIYVMQVTYSILCGEWRQRFLPIPLMKDVLEGHGPYICIAGSGSLTSIAGLALEYNHFETKTSCNPCLGSILGCPWPGPKFSGAARIIPVLSKKITDAVSWIDFVLSFKTTPSDKIIKRVGEAIVEKIYPDLSFIKGLVNCFENVHKDCKDIVSGFLGAKPLALASSQNNGDPKLEALVELLYSLQPIILSVDYAYEVLGNMKWLYVGDSHWNSNILKPVFDERGSGGVYVTESELESVQQTLPTTIMPITSEDVVSLVQRFNTTFTMWESGILEPTEGENFMSYSIITEVLANISEYNDILVRRGHANYLEASNYALNEFRRLNLDEEEDGVCAVVRISIEQSISLTREAFEARLQIENQEVRDLVEIKVDVEIFDEDTGALSNRLFSLSQPSLSGSLTAVDGNGKLSKGLQGAATWLIVPYSEAAPTDSKNYKIGGSFSYKVGELVVDIPLLPSPITVIPDPSLVVHYFWEKYVFADDPFTPDIEPSIPTTLGLMIMNRGYGTAYDVKIATSQPEIIENEKGLLVTFELISVQVGNNDFNPILNIEFGDLGRNEIQVARWKLRTSLMGEFKNYSATFENINPLGDPKLSVLDELEVHELIHSVLLYGSDDVDDDILDFLVNDKNDVLSMPDIVYNSKDLSSEIVLEGNITKITVNHTEEFLQVDVWIGVDSSGWKIFYYVSISDHINDIDVGNSIVFYKMETNHSEPVFLPPENAWVVLDVNHRSRKRNLYFFDNVEGDELSYHIRLCPNCQYKPMPSPSTTPITGETDALTISSVLNTQTESDVTDDDNKEDITTVTPLPTTKKGNGVNNATVVTISGIILILIMTTSWLFLTE